MENVQQLFTEEDLTRVQKIMVEEGLGNHFREAIEMDVTRAFDVLAEELVASEFGELQVGKAPLTIFKENLRGDKLGFVVGRSKIQCGHWKNKEGARDYTRFEGFNSLYLMGGTYEERKGYVLLFATKSGYLSYDAGPKFRSVIWLVR